MTQPQSRPSYAAVVLGAEKQAQSLCLYPIIDWADEDVSEESASQESGSGWMEPTSHESPWTETKTRRKGKGKGTARAGNGQGYRHPYRPRP